ncbi:uncharacterized protein (DUF362 family) [Desulfitispora alkaliphila]|uniref:DUF362 domain-containing protein n=1 Tax=Desulfitispora alkaliphila TaxID=622674 RepID=UPI003D1CA647
MSKAEIWIKYGHSEEEMIEEVLEAMDVAGDLQKLDHKNPLIGIKPNLVVAQVAEWGATTSPKLVRGLVKYLKQKGFNNIVILESAWVGDSTEKAFEVCGYQDISREFDIPLLDLKEDEGLKFTVEDMKIEVCKKVLELDYLINMPVLKAHCQTKVTCSLKNLKGCIRDSEKRRFHTMGLHKPIAYLNKIIKTDLIIVDGIVGDLTYEGGGTPVRMNRIIAGRDPVLIDSYAAELIGYSSEEIDHIVLAAKMGIGKMELKEGSIMELNSKREAQAPENIMASKEADYLKKWIEEDDACSACYGSLVHALMRVKDKNDLDKITEKIHIGQGYRGKEEELVGVGNCAKGLKHHVMGCPPKAKDIVAFFNKLGI